MGAADLPVLEFDEASHVYRVKDRIVPGVTTIIKSLSDFSGISPAVLEAKRQLGTDVHLACELDDLGELDEDSTDEAVLAYLEGWRRFKRETGARVLMNEQRLFHPGLWFAGTIDRMVDIPGEPDLFLIDLKTAVCMSDSFGVQLAAYRILAAPTVERIGPAARKIARKGLQLRPDGTYKLISYTNPNDEPCFRGLLAVHNWKASQK